MPDWRVEKIRPQGVPEPEEVREFHNIARAVVLRLFDRQS